MSGDDIVDVPSGVWGYVPRRRRDVPGYVEKKDPQWITHLNDSWDYPIAYSWKQRCTHICPGCIRRREVKNCFGETQIEWLDCPKHKNVNTTKIHTDPIPGTDFSIGDLKDNRTTILMERLSKNGIDPASRDLWPEIQEQFVHGEGCSYSTNPTSFLTTDVHVKYMDKCRRELLDQLKLIHTMKHFMPDSLPFEIDRVEKELDAEWETKAKFIKRCDGRYVNGLGDMFTPKMFSKAACVDEKDDFRYDNFFFNNSDGTEDGDWPDIQRVERTHQISEENSPVPRPRNAEENVLPDAMNESHGRLRDFGGKTVELDAATVTESRQKELARWDQAVRDAWHHRSNMPPVSARNDDLDITQERKACYRLEPQTPTPPPDPFAPKSASKTSRGLNLRGGELDEETFIDDVSQEITHQPETSDTITTTSLDSSLILIDNGSPGSSTAYSTAATVSASDDRIKDMYSFSTDVPVWSAGPSNNGWTDTSNNGWTGTSTNNRTYNEYKPPNPAFDEPFALRHTADSDPSTVLACWLDPYACKCPPAPANDQNEQHNPAKSKDISEQLNDRLEQLNSLRRSLSQPFHQHHQGKMISMTYDFPPSPSSSLSHQSLLPHHELSRPWSHRPLIQHPTQIPQPRPSRISPKTLESQRPLIEADVYGHTRSALARQSFFANREFALWKRAWKVRDLQDEIKRIKDVIVMVEIGKVRDGGVDGWIYRDYDINNDKNNGENGKSDKNEKTDKGNERADPSR